MEPEKNDHLLILLDNIETQVWYLIDERTYGLVNQAHADFFGAKKEELQNKDLYELMSTREEAEECIAGNLEVFSQKQKIHTEELVLNGNGEERLLSITKTPKLDQHNSVEYVTCSAEDITERKQEKEALQESRNLLNNVFQSIQDGISILNTDLTIRDVNQTMESWYSHAAPLIGKKCYEVYQNRFEPCDPCPSIRALEGKTTCSDIVSFMGENKQVGWLELFSYPIIDQATGTVNGIVEFVRDITEQKKAEMGFISLVENSPDMVVRHDIDSCHLYVNSTAERELSISKEFLLGKTYYEAYRALRGEIDVNDPLYQQFEKMTQLIKEVAQTKEEKEVYNELFGKHLHGRIVPEFDEKGQVNSVLVVTRDITEQKQMEKDLQESEEKFKMLAESSPLAILMYQNDYWVYANPAAEQISGYSIDELYNMQFWDFVHPDYKEVVKSVGKKRQEGIDDQTPYEFKIITKQGLEKWIFLSGATVNYQGAPAGMINCLDITESKVAESELQRAYALLENEIRKASTIHEKILPQKIPQPQNISIAAHFQPAEIMGGDLYNVVQHEGKLIFYLSDVSGHGLDGAMISVFIKEAIDSYVELESDEIKPGRIIKHIGKQYYRENYPDEQMICILVGVIDLHSMELRYSSAGFQNYPLVHWGSGERKKLETSGLFISNTVPYELLNFEESSVYLNDGTTIMFSTDGLFEQKSGAEWFYQYAEEVFYRYSHFSPEIIVQAVNKEFCFFNSHSLLGEDDITFLVLQVGNHSNQQQNFSYEITSDLTELKPLYEKISGILSGYEGQENFLTCLHELVANAMEHGNQFDPDKKVAISLTLAPQYIAAEVEDEGEGFNWSEKINKHLNIEDFSERGRGIPLTGLLSRNLFYNSEGNKATLVMEI